MQDISDMSQPAVTGSGVLTTVLGQWVQRWREVQTLSNLSLDSKGKIRLQIKGIIGTGAPNTETHVLLHNGQFWIKCHLINSYKNDVLNKWIDVHDIVQIFCMRGHADNLLITAL